MAESVFEGVTQGYALGEAMQTQPMRRQSQALELQKLGLEVQEARRVVDSRGKLINELALTLDPADSPKEQMLDYANALAKSGFPEAGLEALSKVADNEQKQADLALKERQQRGEEYTQLAQTFVGIQDKDTYDRTWEKLRMMYPEISSDEKLMQLSQSEDWQTVRDMMVDYAISSQTKAQIEADQARARAADAQAEKDRMEMEIVLPARAAQYNARAKAIEKSGGSAGGPTKVRAELQRAIADKITAAYQMHDPSGKAAAKDLGRKGADIAEMLMADAEDEGEELTVEEAADEAVQILKGRGDLAGLRGTRRGKGSRENPLDLATVDPAKVTAGSWIRNKQGRVGYYDGERVLTPEEFDEQRGNR